MERRKREQITFEGKTMELMIRFIGDSYVQTKYKGN